MKYHRLGGLDSKHLFLTVCEAVKSKVRAPEVWYLVITCFLLHGQHLLLVLLHGGQCVDALWFSFIWALMPFVRVPTSWPKLLLKSPLPNTITLGLCCNIQILGCQSIPSIADDNAPLRLLWFFLCHWLTLIFFMRLLSMCIFPFVKYPLMSLSGSCLLMTEKEEKAQCTM